MTSLFKIAEQIRSILGKGDWQEYEVAITQALAWVVKQEYFAGRQEGVTEVNGQFIFSFPGTPVALDSTRNKYYATLPASFINLPHNYGVTSISPEQGESNPFVALHPGMMGLFSGLDASGFEGNQTYYLEGHTQGTRIWLPQLTASDNVSTLLVKLAVSLDGIDADTEIALSPEVQDAIIRRVIEMYAPQEPKEKLN